jgi:hypothetical protein
VKGVGCFLRLLLLLRFLLRFRLFALLGFDLLVLRAVVDDADVAKVLWFP